MIVTVQMTQDLGFCAKGLRRWAAYRGLSYTDFVKNGITVEKLEPFKDDPYVKVILLSIEGIR